MSLSDDLPSLQRKEAQRLEKEKWLRRVRERSPVYPSESAADAVRAERDAA